MVVPNIISWNWYIFYCLSWLSQFKFLKSLESSSGKNQKDDAEERLQVLKPHNSYGAVGTGNIGGVALAIWTGGPAAIF